jgi:hypothetical protein
MKKLIIFTHHYISDVIIHRFENLKKLNQDWDIVSIGFNEHFLLPGSLRVDKSKYPSNESISYFVPGVNVNWFDCDLLLYDAFLQKPDYDEYFLYEHDTICNVSIESFFDTNVDFFGSNINNPSTEEWEWVKLYRKHNPYNSFFDKIYSYGQSTCIYFKKQILKQCAEEVLKNKHLYNNMYCEARGGTIASQFTELKKGREDIHKFISWTPNDIQVDTSKPHFYHPVK